MLLGMMPDEAGEDNESLHAGLVNLLNKWDADSANQLFPFLASLLGIPLSENENAAIKYLDPVSLRQKLQGAFIKFIKEKTRNQLLHLIWEDLHWADKETLQVIEKLCSECKEVSLISILSFRPQKEEGIWQLHEKLKTTDNYQVLQLDALTAEENNLLIQNMAGRGVQFTEAANLIFEKSEGNPFYSEELFRSLREQGYFQKNDNEITRPVNFILPATLHGIVASRIDKLSPEEKWTLQASSVVGRIIDLPVLHSLTKASGKNINIDNTINALLASDMIRKSDSGYEDSDEYFFKHAITQEVAYNGLLISTRMEIHNQVADSITILYGPEHFFIVANHYQKGNNNEKAITYYKKAAEYAAANFSHENELNKLYQCRCTLKEVVYRNRQ